MAEWRDAVERWLIAHNTGTDLAAVWTLAVCFAVMGTVNLMSWWVLRDSRDHTGIGPALKGKKAAEAVADFAMAALYALSLWGWYVGYAYGPWWRIGIRALVAGGLLVAGVFGVRFIIALKREIDDGPATVGDIVQEV